MRAERRAQKGPRGDIPPRALLRVYREIERPRTKATFRRYRSPGRFTHVAPDISLRPSATIPFACLQPSISLIACACISHSTTICMRMRESPSTPGVPCESRCLLGSGIMIYVAARYDLRGVRVLLNALLGRMARLVLDIHSKCGDCPGSLIMVCPGPFR